MVSPSPAPPKAQPQPSIEELLATRLSVTSLKIQGATRTNPKLLDRLLGPVLSTGGTFEGVVEDVSIAVDRLRATNCFRGVDAYLDTTASGDASVLFTVAEKGWYQIHTGTSMETSGERGALVEGSFLFRNLRGCADTLKASLEWGGSGASLSPNPSTAWDVEYKRPFIAGLDTSGFTNFRDEQRNHAASSSYALHTRSGEAGVDSPLGRFAVSAAWREVGRLTKDASPVIREEAKHTWLTAARHTIARDTRDSAAMPTAGGAARLSCATALPLGDVAFSAVEASAQAHAAVAGGCVSVSARGGAVLARGGGGARTALPDRFFLGGANSLRGFAARGVGPRDGGDALGGDLFYTATAMVSHPFPRASLLAQMFNARLHAFATAGDLTEVAAAREGVRALDGTPAQRARQAWRAVAGSARVAVGCGVALETALGRVELNVCQALRARAGDQPRTGVQFGISESFS